MTYINSQARQLANTHFFKTKEVEEQCLDAFDKNTLDAAMIKHLVDLSYTAENAYDLAAEDGLSTDEYLTHLSDITAVKLIRLNIMSSAYQAMTLPGNVVDEYKTLFRAIAKNNALSLQFIEEAAPNTVKLITDNLNKALYCQINMSKQFSLNCGDNDDALLILKEFIDYFKNEVKTSTGQVQQDLLFSLGFVNEKYADICSVLSEDESLADTVQLYYLASAQLAYLEAKEYYLSQDVVCNIRSIELSILNILEKKMLLHRHLSNYAQEHAKELLDFEHDCGIYDACKVSGELEASLGVLEHLILATKMLPDFEQCIVYCNDVTKLYEKAVAEGNATDYQEDYERALSIKEECEHSLSINQTIRHKIPSISVADFEGLFTPKATAPLKNLLGESQISTRHNKQAVFSEFCTFFRQDETKQETNLAFDDSRLPLKKRKHYHAPSEVEVSVLVSDEAQDNVDDTNSHASQLS